MTRQIVIYAAADLQQAHLLKNELERHDIRAWVTNETLSRGFSVECPTWGTLPRVIVEEKDAAAARQIALAHDRDGAQQIENQLPDPAHFEHDPQVWPRCPECGAPRPTRCPICKTTGTDFPETDPDFAWGMGLEEVAHESSPEAQASCSGGSCGPGGCSAPRPGEVPLPEEAGSPVDEGEEEDHERPFILRCNMCDEPFSPEFPNLCPWCDYEFEDGYDVDPSHHLPERDSSARIFLLLFGLLAISLLVLWFLLN
ncbi:MAG: hypothetical protein PVH19_08385 [Planctomycetia bacterium]|jgi:rubrerythrin